MSKVLSSFPSETRPGSHGNTLVPGPQTVVPDVRGEITAAIGCFAASGNLDALRVMLNRALDTGLSISECKEVLVQIYAYAGFPRSLNGLGALMSVVSERRKRGLNDLEGPAPSPLPSPSQMLTVGTSNQTQLVGKPVTGALFDFCPEIDQYLKTHLFGDIFARDNVDWKTRELATVGALSALAGAESQLQAHLNISLNIGIDARQLRKLPVFFDGNHAGEAATRLQDALDATLGQEALQDSSLTASSAQSSS